MYNHYARIDENNNVIKTFTDGFEQPIEGDVLIKESEDRHFNISIRDGNNCYRYKIHNNEIIEKTDEEKKASPEYINFKMVGIREKRDRLMDNVDIRICNADRWEDMTVPMKQQWRAYKQALRDLPDNIDDIDNVEYPAKPN